MEKYLVKIAHLEKEIVSRDEDVRLAATYGKQLLEERSQLKTEIEKLQQEKHSLQLKLEMNMKIMESQTQEIDSEKDKWSNIVEELDILKKDNVQMNKRLQEKFQENETLRKSVDELVLSNQSLKEKITALEGELKTYHDQLQVSFNETNSEEFLKLSIELQKCHEEKQALLSLAKENEYQLDKFKTGEEKLTKMIESLREGLKERDAELQAYSVIVEKGKEENMELMGQIELLKLEQLDVNRKGNSIFGEVEDRRRAVEKELIFLKKKHECLQENYNIRLMEMKKLRHQMDIFLGMFSQKADYNYMQQLEDSLRGAQKEIEYLSKCLTDNLKTQDSSFCFNPIIENHASSEDEYGYLRALLLQSRKKVEELEKELQNQLMLKLAETDRHIETKRQLYRTEKMADGLKGENLRLKLKLQDLTMKPGDEKTGEPKCRKELIPGFVKAKEPANNGSNNSDKAKVAEENTPKVSKSSSKKENQLNGLDLFYTLHKPLSYKKKSSQREISFRAMENRITDNKHSDSMTSNYSPHVSKPLITSLNDCGGNECAQQ